MSDSFEEDPFAPVRIRDPRPAAPPSLPLIAHYGLALVFVALATGVAFLVQHLISADYLYHEEYDHQSQAQTDEIIPDIEDRLLEMRRRACRGNKLGGPSEISVRA